MELLSEEEGDGCTVAANAASCSQACAIAVHMTATGHPHLQCKVVGFENLTAILATRRHVRNAHFPTTVPAHSNGDVLGAQAAKTSTDQDVEFHGRLNFKITQESMKIGFGHAVFCGDCGFYLMTGRGPSLIAVGPGCWSRCPRSAIVPVKMQLDARCRTRERLLGVGFCPAFEVGNRGGLPWLDRSVAGPLL
ncbi:hypothetical protein ACLOJK_039013 [Asimina triloba]